MSRKWMDGWQVKKEDVLTTPTPADVGLSEVADARHVAHAHAALHIAHTHPTHVAHAHLKDSAGAAAPADRTAEVSWTSTPGIGRLDLSDVADDSMMSSVLDVGDVGAWRMTESRPISAKAPRRVRSQSSAPHQPALALEDNPLYKDFMRFSQGIASSAYVYSHMWQYTHMLCVYKCVFTCM